MNNLFKKYNINKYRQILIIFIVFIILLLFMINIYYYNFSNNKQVNELFTEISSKSLVIDRYDDLIKNYKIYSSELKYYLNKENEYYVKDSNKDYARYIENLTRNESYYSNKLNSFKYPINLIFDNNCYYIDYNIKNNVIRNKVIDLSWTDFNLLHTNTIITIYNLEYDINNIKKFLKEYDYLYFQVSDIQYDILYDNYEVINVIYNYIINSVIGNIFNEIKKNMIDKTINDKIINNNIINTNNQLKNYNNTFDNNVYNNINNNKINEKSESNEDLLLKIQNSYLQKDKKLNDLILLKAQRLDKNNDIDLNDTLLNDDKLNDSEINSLLNDSQSDSLLNNSQLDSQNLKTKLLKNIKINKVYTDMSDKINTDLLDNIYKLLINNLNNEQINTLIKSNKIQILLKELKLENILNIITTNNVTLTIETRDDRYIFVYNKYDMEGYSQLINLFKYLNDKEDLTNFSDRIIKDLRYFRIPINVLRIMERFKRYIKLP